MKKTLLVILDGAADKEKSAFATARKPYIDMLASNSSCGLWSGVRAACNKRSLSGIATLEILGYTEKDEPGRGYLEALGLGLKIPKNSVCMRGNFATVKQGKISDRRAGRDETGLNELVHDINKKFPSVGDVKLRMHRLVGHRFVLVLTGPAISKYVSDGDFSDKPEKIVSTKKGSEKTAKVLNEFVELTSHFLATHPVNAKRNVPANYLLLRSPGSEQKVDNFSKKYRINACVISGMNIVIGVCRYVGIDVIETPPTELEGDLFVRARRAIDALEKYDMVILHINGADVYSHDKNFSGKVSYLERIDREVFSQITKLRSINIFLLSDHITSSLTGEHEFGSVPFLIYDCDEDGDELHHKFDEKSCQRSFISDNPMKKITSVL